MCSLKSSAVPTWRGLRTRIKYIIIIIMYIIVM